MGLGLHGLVVVCALYVLRIEGVFGRAVLTFAG